MRVLIAGSRNYSDLAGVKKYVLALPEGTVVLSGMARGVDATAAVAAKERGLEVEIFPAEWSKYGTKAGIMRNMEMVNSAAFVVCFWDGESSGTAHTMNYAEQQEKPLLTIRSEINGFG